jgi:hypothetical protein
VSVARITDTVYNYLIRWWPVLAMLLWLSAAWSLWCVAAPKLAGLRLRLPAPTQVRAAAVAAGLALVLWSSHVLLLQVQDSQPPEQYLRDPLATLAGPTIAATPPGGPILVDSAGGGSTSVTDGLRLQLERANRPTVGPSEQTYKFGAQRDAATVEPVTEVWVVSGEAIVEFADRRDMKQVAIWDPLPSTQRARYFTDVEVLRNQILATKRMDLFDALYSFDSLFPLYGMKGIDQDLLKRVDELRFKGRPVAVFVGPRHT